MSIVYEKDNELVYFSHIPRTGGRYVSQLLHCNGYKEYARPIHTNVTRHITLHNAKSSCNVKNMLSKAQKITVIRHPLNRFRSATNSQFFLDHYMDGKIENFKKMDDLGYFKYVLKEKEYMVESSAGDDIMVNGLESLPTGWFLKQTRFLDHEFAIWRFEDGLDEPFRQFLKKNHIRIDVRRAVNRSVYKKQDFDIPLNNYFLSTKLKNNVLKFYKEDHELWKR